VPLVGVAREGVARELLSLHRKNYVTAGIVFMLDNYGARARARARPDRDRAMRRVGRETRAGGWQKTAGRGKVFRRIGRVEPAAERHPANE